MSTSHFSAKAFSKMADDDLSSELSVNVKVSFRFFIAEDSHFLFRKRFIPIQFLQKIKSPQNESAESLRNLIWTMKGEKSKRPVSVEENSML